MDQRIRAAESGAGSRHRGDPVDDGQRSSYLARVPTIMREGRLVVALPSWRAFPFPGTHPYRLFTPAVRSICRRPLKLGQADDGVSFEHLRRHTDAPCAPAFTAQWRKSTTRATAAAFPNAGLSPMTGSAPRSHSRERRSDHGTMCCRRGIRVSVRSEVRVEEDRVASLDVSIEPAEMCKGSAHAAATFASS